MVNASGTLEMMRHQDRRLNRKSATKKKAPAASARPMLESVKTLLKFITKC